MRLAVARVIFGLAFLPFFVTAVAAESAPMKGVELYSWKDQDRWWYAVLPGRNAVPAPAEVRAVATDRLEPLERALSKYPRGTEVFWNTRRDVELLTAKPPRGETKRIRAICEKLGFKLVELPELRAASSRSFGPAGPSKGAFAAALASTSS